MGLKEDLKKTIEETTQELSTHELSQIETTEKVVALIAAQKSYIKILESKEQKEAA